MKGLFTYVLQKLSSNPDFQLKLNKINEQAKAERDNLFSALKNESPNASAKYRPVNDSPLITLWNESQKIED